MRTRSSDQSYRDHRRKTFKRPLKKKDIISYLPFSYSKENRNILIEYGVINDLSDNLHDKTIRIRIYKKGGHLEILNNGLFSVGLDRTTYENKNIEPIDKESDALHDSESSLDLLSAGRPPLKRVDVA